MTKQEYEAAIAELRERHEAFVRKVCSEAQRAADLATCTSLTSYLANEILALCDAALAVVPLPEWQPIETAPKDGTRVLLWRRAIRDQPAPIMADGFWCETCWVWPYILSEPTHWQPLPAPPERAGK